MKKSCAHERGNAMVEMALVLLPLMAMMLAIADYAIPIFLHSALMNAVREGCRFGITYQTTYGGTTYGAQTAAIKAVVQANAMGFLPGSAGPDQDGVHYYSPVPPFRPGSRAGAHA